MGQVPGPDVFEKNIAVLRERFPGVCSRVLNSRESLRVDVVSRRVSSLSINQLLIASCYEPRREASRQASLIPQDSREAWVYGLGSGALPRFLLARPNLSTLHVVLFNPAVAQAVFRFFDASDWLADPRVSLGFAVDETTLHAPFAANFPCLMLADEASSRLRDMVCLELSTPFIREKHSAHNAHLKQRLHDNEPYVRADGDVASLFGTRSGQTLVVAAAGPSLADQFGWMGAQRQRFALLAVNTALKPLVAAGLIPDAVVIIDEGEHLKAHFQGMDTEVLRSVPLVYFPRVHGEVLSLWPGPRLTAYPPHELYAEIRQQYPKGALFASGSVLHPAVDLAVRMGADRLILAGADLAYPRGQRYVAGSAVSGKNMAPTSEYWVLDGEGERVPTSASLRGYLRDLEGYIERHPGIRFVNSSRQGARIAGTSFLAEERDLAG